MREEAPRLGRGGFHDGAVRGEVAAEDDEGGGGVKGGGKGADDGGGEGEGAEGSGVEELAKIFAGEGGSVEVQEGAEGVQQREHPARVVELGHVVVAAGLEVDEERGAAADGVDGVDGDAALEGGVPVDDCEQVDHGVGGAADGLQDGDGIEEGGVG